MLTSILPFSAETAAAVDAYCLSHSSPLPSTLADHQAWTTRVSQFPNWASSPVQAQLFMFLAGSRHAQRVLDIGSFTGCSALTWKEGMREWGGEVWTLELDPQMIDICNKAFQQYDLEQKIHLLTGPALET
jgi:predicted O-methyltransferase YrrM